MRRHCWQLKSRLWSLQRSCTCSARSLARGNTSNCIRHSGPSKTTTPAYTVPKGYGCLMIVCQGQQLQREENHGLCHLQPCDLSHLRAWWPLVSCAWHGALTPVVAGTSRSLSVHANGIASLATFARESSKVMAESSGGLTETIGKGSYNRASLSLNVSGQIVNVKSLSASVLVAWRDSVCHSVSIAS
eukprot:TRINITY_DN106582_c0_g1_i1.p1 TRINITY_DN106582_c0_g1~~TRINITY_DN106582_c0_g1_i1.p1  ORF type:complete len:188 (-),score=18.24 TRINITY_DN106582_c0_g1_i1:1-564(-)